MDSLLSHYAAADIETRLLDAIRAAGMDPTQRLSPEALAPLDHFHTGGLRATLDLLERARFQPGHRVLDIGAGLGGAARIIAAAHGCRVDCLELSPDYCTGAELLNRLTGLAEVVGVHQGSALDLPFPDATFDAAWMQNVGMNIADKHRLYAEVRRVLKPGGRFAFQEIAAGSAPTSYYPLPWASDPADSVLISAEAFHALLGESGFVAEYFEDVSESQLNPPPSGTRASAASGELTLAVFVDDLAEKAGNATRSLREGQIRFVRGVFRAC